jgi:hypothetical protein
MMMQKATTARMRAEVIAHLEKTLPECGDHVPGLVNQNLRVPALPGTTDLAIITFKRVKTITHQWEVEVRKFQIPKIQTNLTGRGHAAVMAVWMDRVRNVVDIWVTISYM